jgi:hypothetical protein
MDDSRRGFKRTRKEEEEEEEEEEYLLLPGYASLGLSVYHVDIL